MLDYHLILIFRLPASVIILTWPIFPLLVDGSDRSWPSITSWDAAKDESRRLQSRVTILLAHVGWSPAGRPATAMPTAAISRIEVTLPGATHGRKHHAATGLRQASRRPASAEPRCRAAATGAAKVRQSSDAIRHRHVSPLPRARQISARDCWPRVRQIHGKNAHRHERDGRRP